MTRPAAVGVTNDCGCGSPDWTWTGKRLITLQRDEILVIDAPGRGRRLRLDADVEWGAEVLANGDVLLLAEATADGRGLRLRRVNLAVSAGAPS